MNYTRIALAAVAAIVADFMYGFIVFGNLLTSSFLAQTGIYRTAEAQVAKMPIGASGMFVAMIAATILFARSTFRRTAADGLMFGLLLAMFAIGVAVLVNYATINMQGDHAVRMVLAGLGEWLVVGAVIGAVYRDSARP